MSLHEISDEDLVTGLLLQEIRRMDEARALELKLRRELLEIHQRLVDEAQGLRTKVAMLEAEVARLRVPAQARVGSPVEPKSRLAEMVEKQQSDYFGSIP